MLSRFLRIGLQSLKKVLIWPKNFLFTKFEYGYQKYAELYADFETVEKNAKNSLLKKLQAKKGANLGIFLFYTTNLRKFFANNFFWVHFFQFFPQIWNQREILRILDTHIQKKNLNKFWGHCVQYVYYWELV